MGHHSGGMEGETQGLVDLRPGKQLFCFSVYLKHQFLLLEEEEKERDRCKSDKKLPCNNGS